MIRRAATFGAGGVPIYRQSHRCRELVDMAAHRDRRDGSLFAAGLLALQTILRLLLRGNSDRRRDPAGLVRVSHRARRRDPRSPSLSSESELLFLACFAFINILPASNLLFLIGTIRADRLLYLPSLGLLGCAVLAICAATRNPGIPAAVLCLIAAGFALRTWMRNQDWQSEFAIATADVQTSPNSFKLHQLLASSLFDSDRIHANMDRVIDEQEKALKILEGLTPRFLPPNVFRTAGYYYLLEARKNGQKKDDPLYQKATTALLQSIAIGRIPDRQAFYCRSRIRNPAIRQKPWNRSKRPGTWIPSTRKSFVSFQPCFSIWACEQNRRYLRQSKIR